VHDERQRVLCPGYADGLDGASSIGLPVVIKYGPEWMKQMIIPKVFAGDETVALAITEAFAGSDVAGLRTRAVLDEAGENYIINGHKKWITGAMYADWFVTAARTGGKGHGGISMILVPRSDAIKTKVIKSRYSHSAGTAFMSYENATAPKKNVFGEENKGFQIIMSNFNHERWMISVAAVAQARVCTEEVFKWAMQRKVFGQRLSEQPVIRAKLAECFGGVESVTAMLLEVTHSMNILGSQSPQMGSRIALFKYMTTRMCHTVADTAVQILGGRGVSIGGMGRVIETFHRYYKVPSVYGGSEEIMADLTVRQAIKNFPQTSRL